MELRVLDLFAGCGGLSLGLQQAGHSIVAACERDLWAGDTYATNHPLTQLIREDITTVSSSFWKKHFHGQIDLVAGGPPCQGFSISGKRQSGHVLQQNNLITELLSVVRETKPKYVLVENVGGFKTGKLHGKIGVLDYALCCLADLGFETRVIQLQALEYGVPSMRTRLFILGSTTGFHIEPMPLPTHAKTGSRTLSRYITIEDALSDMPPLQACQGVTEGAPYHSPPRNIFQREMRMNSKGVFNHVAMNHSPRLVERFRSIPPGSSAYRMGNEPQANTKVVTVYKSNNQRLRSDQPSLCVTANFQSTHVHYRDHRTLTAREAARLMTFPDCFVFKGKRTQMSGSFLKKYGREHENYLSQYNQIGNAVPPTLAKALGLCLSRLAERDSSSKKIQPTLQPLKLQE